MQDSQGPIADRTREHLGPTDLGIMHFRKLVMEAARALLEQARVNYTAAVLVGPVPETIARYASENACDKIVIGRRGLGAIGSALMGSVTTRLMHLTDLPVTLVK